MPVIDKTISPTRDEDLFLGTHGIRPNTVTTIGPEQAEDLQGDCGTQPSPALQKAFEARKQNQATSRTSK